MQTPNMALCHGILIALYMCKLLVEIVKKVTDPGAWLRFVVRGFLTDAILHGKHIRPKRCFLGGPLPPDAVALLKGYVRYSAWESSINDLVAIPMSW